jgi:ATP-dependent protease HslVU (ClpYQ) peptidase subunit
MSTLGDTKVSAKYDARPGKIVEIQGTYIGLVGSAANVLVFEDIIRNNTNLCDFSSISSIFQTFRRLHPKLKEEYFLLPGEEEFQPYESSQVDALIANANGIFGVQSYREVYEYTRFWATGSGWRYALGAMYSSYEKALDAETVVTVGVEAGCEFDDGSGLPVECFSVPTEKANNSPI